MRERASATMAKCLGMLLPLLALAGCAYHQGVNTLVTSRCVADAEQRVQEADWSQAKLVSLRIRQGEFSPMVLNLRVEQPYVLRITNGDDTSRVFRAAEFFENVALARVDVAGSVADESCIAAVVIGPRQTADVLFVTVRDGRYQFADNRVLSSLFDLGHPMGVIYVQ